MHELTILLHMNRTCRDNGFKPKSPKSTGSGGGGSDPKTNSILQSTARSLQLDSLINYVTNNLSVIDHDDENRSPKRIGMQQILHAENYIFPKRNMNSP